MVGPQFLVRGPNLAACFGVSRHSLRFAFRRPVVCHSRAAIVRVTAAYSTATDPRLPGHDSKNSKRSTGAPLADTLASKPASVLKNDTFSPQLTIPAKGRTLFTPSLREACPCEICVNPISGQRRFGRFQVPSQPKIEAVEERQDGSLRVTWEDDFMAGGGSHESIYTAEFLDKHWAFSSLKSGDYIRRTVWDRAILEKQMRPVRYEDWTQGGDEFWQAFVQLGRLGIVLIKGVPQSESAVEEMAQAIGPLQNTIYGLTWDVVSKPNAENVAYTNEFLGLHQDLCYWESRPKLQLLHCLANECSGGESIFSDALRADLALLYSNAEHHETLCKRRVDFKYTHGEHSYEHKRRTLEQSHGLRVANWSPPFEKPMPLAMPGRIGLGEDMRTTSLYSALQSFEKLASRPESVYSFKMSPGDCVIFDNQRILHGRYPFDASQGKRWLKGAYVEDQVYRSKELQLPKAYGSFLARRAHAFAEEDGQVRHMLGIEGPAVADSRVGPRPGLVGSWQRATSNAREQMRFRKVFGQGAVKAN